MQLLSGKKVYFLSDFHLGFPNYETSLEREKKIVRFLEVILKDAAAIFIVGDLFDFWYEYRTVVPKGYVRILGKMAEITDCGIPLYFFVGNHDMWMKGYFEKELNVPVFYEPKIFEYNSRKFYIGHGDGFGPGDHGYKFIKKLIRSKFAQLLFGLVPPYVGLRFASYMSRSSRTANSHTDDIFLGEEKERLIAYSKEVLQKELCHYFIFGHRHLPIDIALPDNSRYVNVGDWVHYDSYAVFDGHTVKLKYYNEQSQRTV